MQKFHARLLRRCQPKCGHIFWKGCIKMAISRQNKCPTQGPTCRKKVTAKELIRYTNQLCRPWDLQVGPGNQMETILNLLWPEFEFVMAGISAEVHLPPDHEVRLFCEL
ncbi:unnamed protein product [Brassica oleracea var. botrytis]